MIKRNDFGIEYDSNQKKIYFIDENGEKTEGNVDFNHERKEIRLYNFRKTELTVTQKAYIMYSIIEAEYLFPNYFKSNEIALGNITEYTFLINGYLSDGTFKEQNRKYKSIVEEIIESALEITDESSIIKLIHDINYFSNKYSNEMKPKVDGICDEKAASAYWHMERSIKTFSLEVSSFQHGKLRDGWIINDSLDTTHYLFCWLSATKRWFGKDDIKWLEYALVRKADLIEYLESEGLTKEHIIKNRDWILKNVHEKGAVGKNKHKDFYFYYSPQFVERPVNIIVKKDVYLNLSLLHGEIYNEKAK